MKLIHLSDVHVIDLAGAVPGRLLNKRLTGYVNLRLRRAGQHSGEVAERVLQEVRRRAPDHVVITGDMTYLALEREFEGVRRLLRDTLRLPPAEVSLVPGNHDVYTRGSARTGRFEAYLGEYATSDLPNVAGPKCDWTYPYVRLCGPAAIIGVSSAVARAPLVASGVLGAEQRAALRRILRHDEVRSRLPVLLQHHPPTPPQNPLKGFLGGLTDARAQRRILATMDRGLVLHGHLHRRLQRRLDAVESVGATSASLTHGHPDRAAGFNVIELSDVDGAIAHIGAVVFDPARDVFMDVPLSPRGETAHGGTTA